MVSVMVSVVVSDRHAAAVRDGSRTQVAHVKAQRKPVRAADTDAQVAASGLRLLPGDAALRDARPGRSGEPTKNKQVEEVRQRSALKSQWHLDSVLRKIERLLQQGR